MSRPRAPRSAGNFEEPYRQELARGCSRHWGIVMIRPPERHQPPNSSRTPHRHQEPGPSSMITAQAIATQLLFIVFPGLVLHRALASRLLSLDKAAAPGGQI